MIINALNSELKLYGGFKIAMLLLGKTLSKDNKI
jgi:hypothetical protein